MAKFRFPLEQVIKVRKINEDLAQIDLQEAVAVLLHEQNILQKMYDQKTEAFERRHQLQVEASAKSPPMVTIHEYLVGQDVRIERQRKVIQDLETQVEELREVLRQKAIERKIIEELKNVRRQEFAKEESKKEAKEADDMTMMRTRKKGMR